MVMDAPWYVPNTVIRKDLQIPTVKEEIRRYSSQYSARLRAHPNDLTVNLIELPDNRRLRRHLPNDLPTRFLVVFVILVLRFSLYVLFPKATRGFEPISYREALLSTLLHATVYVFYTLYCMYWCRLQIKWDLKK
jgi:hypothetical protein